MSLKPGRLADLQEPSSLKGQRERVVSEKHLQRELLLCCGYFSEVDKEHNKCGKMTYFVEKLFPQMLRGRVVQNRSVKPSRAAPFRMRRRKPQSKPMLLSLRLQTFFQPRCSARAPPPYLGSLMPFPAVDISAEKDPQSETSSGLAGMFLSASGPLLPRPSALMRCFLGSFQP